MKIAAALFAVVLTLQAQDVHRLSEPGVTAPRVKTMVQPDYTQDARDAKIQGTVVLSLEVGADGQARNLQIVRSLDQGLDQNALLAVQRWTFQPGEKEGQPVTVAATIEVNFHLK